MPPSRILTCGDRVLVARVGSPDTPVLLSELRELLRPHRSSSVIRVAEVLDELHLLHDNTISAIRSWIDRRTTELPAGFSVDVRAWITALLDGDSRSRPRSPTSVRVHLTTVGPVIHQLSHTRDHLREVTGDDIDDIVAPLRGHPRRNTIPALRSLFRFAKRRHLVFVDPTRQLRGTGRGATRTLLPMTPPEIAAVRDAVTCPAQRLVVTLGAMHATRGAAIRALTLDALDLSGTTITLAGHEQRLADLTRAALLTWLRHRTQLWPATANRHVLISRKTALGTGPVTADYLGGC